MSWSELASASPRRGELIDVGQHGVDVWTYPRLELVGPGLLGVATGEVELPGVREDRSVLGREPREGPVRGGVLRVCIRFSQQPASESAERFAAALGSCYAAGQTATASTSTSWSG